MSGNGRKIVGTPTTAAHQPTIRPGQEVIAIGAWFVPELLTTRPPTPAAHSASGRLGNCARPSSASGSLAISDRESRRWTESANRKPKRPSLSPQLQKRKARQTPRLSSAKRGNSVRGCGCAVATTHDGADDASRDHCSTDNPDRLDAHGRHGGGGRRTGRQRLRRRRCRSFRCRCDRRRSARGCRAARRPSAATLAGETSAGHGEEQGSPGHNGYPLLLHDFFSRSRIDAYGSLYPSFR